MRWKLVFGLFLVLLSLVIGKITTVTFIIYFGSKIGRYLSAIIYILSWPMLIFGVYICGVEGAEYVRRMYQYLNYKYYHDGIKRHINKRKAKFESILKKK